WRECGNGRRAGRSNGRRDANDRELPPRQRDGQHRGRERAQQAERPDEMPGRRGCMTKRGGDERGDAKNDRRLGDEIDDEGEREKGHWITLRSSVPCRSCGPGDRARRKTSSPTRRRAAPRSPV